MTSTPSPVPAAAQKQTPSGGAPRTQKTQQQATRPSSSSAARPATARPASGVSLSAVKDAERALGRSFRANEQTQFELVRELKPDWNTQKVVEFCKKHGFEEAAISRELTAEFEFERVSHEAASEEWQDVKVKAPKKKDAPASTTTNGAAAPGKFVPGAERPKTAGGKPTGAASPDGAKPTTPGGKKYIASAASDRAYAMFLERQAREKEAAEKKKREVQLPVPGKSFLAALVKPAAPTPTPTPSPPPATAAKPTNGAPAKDAAATATNGGAAKDAAAAKPAAAAAEAKVEEKKEDGAPKVTGPALARLGHIGNKPNPAVAAAAALAAEAKPAAAASAAVAASPAPAAGGKPGWKKGDKPAAAAAAPSTATTTAAATATPAATTTTAAPTTTATTAAAHTTTATPAATATDAAPTSAPASRSNSSTAAPAAAKPAPAAAAAPVNPRVHDLFSSTQKVLIPTHIQQASAASTTFQFGSGAKSGPRAPKPKEVAAPAPAPAAAAPVTQPIPAAIGTGSARPFSSGPAPIGSKPLQHLDSTPANAAATADSDIIAGGHSHFGTACLRRRPSGMRRP